MTLENIDNNHELVNNYKSYKIHLKNYREMFSIHEMGLAKFKADQQQELLLQKNELKNSINTLRSNKNYDSNASDDEKAQIQTIYDEVTQ